MSRLGSFIDHAEETIIAALLAGMTLVTFSQVIARYVFNSGWVAALELTSTMFAWLVLFGISYGVKIGAHLGVDAIIRLFPKPVFRLFAVFAALCSIAWAVFLYVGACGNPLEHGICGSGYVGKMYKLGIATDDLGLPRWLVYSIVPIGMVLFAIRCIQALVQIIRGEREAMVASHEAEELVRENEGVLADPH